MITIIPAIDIIGGQCVRLSKGEFSTKKVYDEDPLAVAQRFESSGFRRLHVVDLDGARQKHIVNLDILHSLCLNTSLEIDFGGGVQSEKDISNAFAAGARYVTAGSIAVKDQQMVQNWITTFGSQRIILGADIFNTKISIHAWQEGTSLDIFDFISSYIPLGIKQVICTDISRDGLLRGPSMDLYINIKKRFPELYLIASGGIGNEADIAALDARGIDAVIIGKAFYEGMIKPEALRPYLC